MCERKEITMVEFEFAKDGLGNIVNISIAAPHKKYICANEECGSNLIPVFGTTGRAYHFRHENTNYTHNGETELHYNMKHLVGKLISISSELFYHYISKNNGRYIGCVNLHMGNGKLDVFIEKNISSNYRPDVSVYKDGQLVYVVEIIVSHDIEISSLEYIEQNRILCINIKASDSLYKYYTEVRRFDFWSDDSNNEYLNFSYHNNRFRDAEENEQREIDIIKNEFEIKYEKERVLLDQRKTQLETVIEEQEKIIKERLTALNYELSETENKIKVLNNNLDTLKKANPSNEWWYNNIKIQLNIFERDIETLPIKIIQILDNGLSLYKVNNKYIEYNPMSPNSFIRRRDA